MPRRWTDLDSDEHRLPEGFRRVGYDADERRHYFRDRDGQMWRSEPGNEYGVLSPVVPEPPVTIPRRPPNQRPPPPYSKDPVDDSPLDEPPQAFTDILPSCQIISASSSTPKRSHTISIPTVASLKRSSTAAASFIRSRGKHLTRVGHSKKPSRDDNSRGSPPAADRDHRRIPSSSATVSVRRSATVAASTPYMKVMMKPGVEPIDRSQR